MKKNLILFFSFICLFSLISCSKKSEIIEFDESEPFALKPGIEWILVTAPYAACHKDAGYEEEVSGHLRRGLIRQVEGVRTIKVDENWEKWFAVSEGWIPGNCVQVYSNRLKAEKAFSALK